jgi:hypothetical protein
VAFVVLDHVLDLDSARPQRFDKVVGLRLHHARIVGALDDHEGCADLIDAGDR